MKNKKIYIIVIALITFILASQLIQIDNLQTKGLLALIVIFPFIGISINEFRLSTNIKQRILLVSGITFALLFQLFLLIYPVLF